jgi:hypothetical protein
MFSSRFRRYLRLQQISTAIASLFVGMLLSVFSNWLSEQWQNLLPLIVALTVIAVGFWLFVMIRQPAGIDVLIRAPRTFRAVSEEKIYARSGFVGFVPIFTPKAGSKAERLTLPKREGAIQNLDFDTLNLEESNLAPTIKAILAHRSRLQHCWLLSTRGKEIAGSLPVARLLAEYLKQKHGVSCHFHYSEEESIMLDDDALVLSKTYELVRRVFFAAEKMGLPAREMVANITTGFRSMTLGMILACLDKDRDIEFVGTQYDQKGKPASDLVPITFSFETVLD